MKMILVKVSKILKYLGEMYKEQIDSLLTKSEELKYLVYVMKFHVYIRKAINKLSSFVNAPFTNSLALFVFKTSIDT